MIRLPARSPLALLWRLPLADLALAAEVTLRLGLARLAVLVLPFRWIATRLGQPHAETSRDLDVAAVDHAGRVGLMVLRVSRHTPWRSNCLAQGLATHAMLGRRGIPSTLYLGATRDGARMHAHAWLRCGNRVLTGAHGRRRYATVMSYASQVRIGSRRGSVRP